jgi:hypothetical protein
MSGKPTPGKKPPFYQRPVEAQRHQKERQLLEENLVTIGKIVSKLESHRDQMEISDKRKATRE